MKRIILLLIVVISFSSCMYEYRKLPNTKRVTKREVRNAMKYSTWEFNNCSNTIFGVNLQYQNKK
jgi:hypothetical protein